MVFKNTCESLLFAMRAVSSVAHQPHLGFLSGCDRELKHGFTFPLSSSSDAGDPPDTCIMQSCNLQSCNQADLSLAAHRRGATKPIPLGGRSSCVFPRRSSVSMRLMPMPRSQADRRCVCCRSRCQKVAPSSMKRGRAIRGRVGPAVVVDSPRESNSGLPASRPVALPRGQTRTKSR